jgi:hypothetical protein
MEVILIKQFGSMEPGTKLEANEILYKHLIRGGWIVETPDDVEPEKSKRKKK